MVIGRLCKRLLQKFVGYNGGDVKYHGAETMVKRDWAQDMYLKIKLTGCAAGLDIVHKIKKSQR